jgi:hypothetical protein
VVSISFSLVEETARDIIGHDCDPIDNIPRRYYIARQYLWPHQLSVKQTAVFAPAVFSRALFVPNFIHRDAGIYAEPGDGMFVWHISGEEAEALTPIRIAVAKAVRCRGPDRGSQVRSRLAGGGEWIRTSSTRKR